MARHGVGLVAALGALALLAGCGGDDGEEKATVESLDEVAACTKEQGLVTRSIPPHTEDRLGELAVESEGNGVMAVLEYANEEDAAALLKQGADADTDTATRVGKFVVLDSLIDRESPDFDTVVGCAGG